MHALWLPILLAPLVTREPVGLNEWHRAADPVHRRIGSLLVGTPIDFDAITVVPLHARVPSEAGHARTDLPLVATGLGLAAKPMFEDGRWYLRLINDNERPVFLASGTCVASAGVEYVLTRDVVVRAKFAAITPIVKQIDGAPRNDEHVEVLGVLPPELVAPLSGTMAATTIYWQAYGEVSLRRALSRARSRARFVALQRAVAAEIGKAGQETTVGIAIFMAGVPIAAHVYLDRNTLLKSLDSILAATALQDIRWRRVGVAKDFRKRAHALDARAATLRLMRQVLYTTGERAELAGEGSHTRYIHPNVGYYDALVTESQEVLHVAYRRGGLRPTNAGGTSRRGPNGSPAPPPGPGPTPNRPNEESNGERARRARPTKEDERLNERRAQPTPKPQPPAQRPAARPPAQPGSAPTRPPR